MSAAEHAQRCSADGCTAAAMETLSLRDQPGHVHDCAQHAHDLREWCDVVRSYPLVDGKCVIVGCTKDPIWSGAPQPLFSPATLRARHERGEWLSDDELGALARGEEADRG